MDETMILEANTREGNGSRAAQKLRNQGMLPAVLYGHKEVTVPLSISTDEFHKILRHGQRIIDLKTNGKVQKSLITEIQWDPFGQEILHVDFTRVSAGELIQVEVEIDVKGDAPGVSAGGILEQPLHAIKVECPAISVPENIKVLINDLELEQAIHVKDLSLPDGVKPLEDPEAVVVQIVTPTEEREEGEEEQAEPEVIKRDKEEEEQEGE